MQGCLETLYYLQYEKLHNNHFDRDDTTSRWYYRRMSFIFSVPVCRVRACSKSLSSQTILLAEGSRDLHSLSSAKTKSTSSSGKMSSSMDGSFNQEEVDKFRRMAKSGDWWDPKGPAQGLISMNKLRVPLIRDGLINSTY